MVDHADVVDNVNPVIAAEFGLSEGVENVVGTFIVLVTRQEFEIYKIILK